MFVSLIQFLPCLTSLALALIYPFWKGRWPNTCFHILGVICTVYFFADATFITFGTEPVTLVSMDVIAQFLSFWIIPLAAFFLYSEWKRKMPDTSAWLSLIPGVIIGANSIRLYHKIGMEKVSEAILQFTSNGGRILKETDPDLLALHYNNYVLNQVILITEAIIVISFVLICIYRKRKEDGFFCLRYVTMCSVTIAALVISIIRVYLERDFMLTHTGINACLSAALSVCFLIIGILYYHHSVVPCSKENTGVDLSAKNDDRMMDALKEKMIAYIENEKAFLDHDISLDKVASALGTNRTYVSMMVNSMMEMTFRDYINGLRICYAKEYLLKKKDATMEDVAEACGFTSGPQFCRKFKEIVGMSPNAWAHSQELTYDGNATEQCRQ